MLASKIESKGHVWETQPDGHLVAHSGHVEGHSGYTMPYYECVVCGERFCCVCAHNPALRTYELPECRGYYLPKEGS